MTTANSGIAHTALDFYAEPGAMTSPGAHPSRLESLPDDVATLAGIAQGLAIHEFMAAEYGFVVPEERKQESHIRSLDGMLDRMLVLDDRPLDQSRPPEKRLVGVCNHFAVLLTGMLRAHRIPARARWGFGAYFNPPFFEDHVLVEYWRGGEGRWCRVDAQLDGVFRKALNIRFDELDVPAEQFIVAGEAWAGCRAGRADPARFGISQHDLHGLWFVACSLIKDFAALNSMEMLPWDTWGSMPSPGSELDDAQLALYDGLAELIRHPDLSFEQIRSRYDTDARLRVPDAVFNSLLHRVETL